MKATYGWTTSFNTRLESSSYESLHAGLLPVSEMLPGNQLRLLEVRDPRQETVCRITTRRFYAQVIVQTKPTRSEMLMSEFYKSWPVGGARLAPSLYAKLS